jgi:glycosyltransferase involved in cell wall biosynthesis
VSAAVDIMLPYYGDVGYFKKAVESVLAQTVQDWRLVVVDDGYPDPEPSRWLNEIAERDSRVHYLRNETNLGANGNYRKALGLVEADLFVMMGADDVMLPNYLSVVLRMAAGYPGADVIQPGVAVIDGNGQRYAPLPDRVKGWYAPTVTGMRELRAEDMAVSLVRADWAYFPSLTWKSATVKEIGFTEGLDVVQDLALLLDVAAGGGALVVGNETAFEYRRHSGSDSSVRAFDGRRFREERDYFRSQAKRFGEMGWKRAARAARNRLTSRLHSGSMAVTAARKKQWEGTRLLLGITFEP